MADSSTTADLDTPISTTKIGVYMEFFIGFREDTDDVDHPRYSWLAQRLAPPDPIPPALYLPVRRTNSRADPATFVVAQYDPFLADVLVTEVGHTLAECGYEEKTNPNLNDNYSVRLSGPFNALRGLITCATNTSFCINNKSVYRQKDVAELWDSGKWAIIHGVSTQLHLGHDNDNAADAVNTYSWRPMKATSPMLELGDLFATGADANAHSQLWLREFVVRLRNNTLMQINPSCRPYMQVQFGDYSNDDDAAQTLIALKRLATMVFLGAEDCLRRAFVAPQRKAQLYMITESSLLRVHPNHKLVKSICGQPIGLNPQRKRTYKNDALGLGNIKFYNEYAAGFNGEAPGRKEIMNRMQERAAAEVTLQAVDGGFSTAAPRRVDLADPRRIAEYARHGLDMGRVIADDIYLVWRCKTVGTLARLLSPHFLEEELSDKDVVRQFKKLGKQFRGVFDFTALRDDEVRLAYVRDTHVPLPVRISLFPPTLDADLLQAQTRVVCGLAHHALTDDQDAAERGRQAAVSRLPPVAVPVQPAQPLQAPPLQPPPLPSAAAPAAAAPNDPWLTIEPATDYLRWLGLTQNDITHLDGFTNAGQQNLADAVDLDGVMRNYLRL